MKGRRYRRVDQGEYRIVYFFDEDTVTIVVVGKRNDDDVYFAQFLEFQATGVVDDLDLEEETAAENARWETLLATEELSGCWSIWPMRLGLKYRPV